MLPLQDVNKEGLYGKINQKTNKLVRLVQVVTVVLPAIQVVRSMIKEHQDEKKQKDKTISK